MASADAYVDEMLSRKFGKEVTNYFAGRQTLEFLVTSKLSLGDTNKREQGALSTASVFSAPTTPSSIPP